jgi:hypothetical protein
MKAVCIIVHIVQSAAHKPFCSSTGIPVFNSILWHPDVLNISAEPDVSKATETRTVREARTERC